MRFELRKQAGSMDRRHRRAGTDASASSRARESRESRDPPSPEVHCSCSGTAAGQPSTGALDAQLPFASEAAAAVPRTPDAGT